MNKRLKYSVTDKMSDLICENYNLLLVMSRFGLSLGFGDQTVQQVCERQGVHTGTFLAVVNFMDGECCVSEEFHDQISVEALMEYLKQASIKASLSPLKRLSITLKVPMRCSAGIYFM